MQMEDTRAIDYVTFEIWVTCACKVIVAVNVHRLNFFVVHSIVK